MTISAPPGILYLCQNLGVLIIPPATVAGLGRILRNHTNLSIPAWVLVLACALSLPAAFALRTIYKQWKDEKDAAAHNAVLPRAIPDTLPAGLGLLRTSLDSFANGYPGEQFEEWAERVPGSTIVNVRILYEDRFFTIEPDHIKAILATQFESFEKGPVFQRQMEGLLGVGVFNSDGEMWKQVYSFHRAMTRPFFSKDRISHFEIFDRHATDALNLLKQRLREGYPVDIQDLASRFTMDSATEFLFSKDVQSLAAGIPYPHYSHLSSASEAINHPANRFARAFDDTQRCLSLRTRRGINWPLSEFWQDRVKKNMVIINEFIDPILTAAVQRKKEADAQESDVEMSAKQENESLLDHLINYTDDEKVLRDETLNILLAGRDTTSNTITYALYMLSKHPEVLQKLRKEVLEKVGETRRPNFEDMREMKYLRAVINETLRLYPAVPFNVRSSNRPVILPGKNGSPPSYIPAGTKVGYSVFLMHRRKDLWGPDADKFDPERFLDDRVKTYITPNPFIFLPFNAGPRICLGQQFAYHETSFFLIRLLQQFTNIKHVPEAQPPSSRPPTEWKLASGTKGTDDFKIKSYLTMSAMGGCWLTMEEVGANE